MTDPISAQLELGDVQALQVEELLRGKSPGEHDVVKDRLSIQRQVDTLTNTAEVQYFTNMAELP